MSQPTFINIPVYSSESFHVEGSVDCPACGCTVPLAGPTACSEHSARQEFVEDRHKCLGCGRRIVVRQVADESNGNRYLVTVHGQD